MRLIIFVDSKSREYRRKDSVAIACIKKLTLKEGVSVEVFDVGNSEENQLLAGSLGVSTLPCFIKFDDVGVELGRVTELGKGLLPPFLEELKE
jgi:hypothetical protein